MGFRGFWGFRVKVVGVRGFGLSNFGLIGLGVSMLSSYGDASHVLLYNAPAVVLDHCLQQLLQVFWWPKRVKSLKDPKNFDRASGGLF